MSSTKKFDNSQALILIVDDLPQNLQVLGSILRKNKYQIAVATNGQQALDVLNNISPDLILLDVMMPELDGHEVCRRLKAQERTREISIIFLTAKSETSDIVKGFELGAVDYVTKPFNATELLARVKTHIELKKNRDVILKLIDELEEKNKILEKLAVTDSLTRIFNHSHIIDRLGKEIYAARRHSDPLSITMFDIDHFKQINDTYGHQVGDEVLVSVTNTIKDVLREIDIIGRYGGEEFLVVMRKTDRKGCYIASERIRKEVEAQEWEHEGLHVTISGGIGTIENDDETAASMIKRADECLYMSKENGRNRIECGTS
jgi:diguanylate cyclase (GGDEF)-like protein